MNKRLAGMGMGMEVGLKLMGMKAESHSRTRLIDDSHNSDGTLPFNQSINQSIRKIFNVSRITNVIARSTET